MGDAFDEILIIPHTYFEAVKHIKKDRIRGPKKHSIFKAPPGTHSGCPEGWPKTVPFFGPDFRSQQIRTKQTQYMTSCLTESLRISCSCLPFQLTSRNGFKVPVRSLCSTTGSFTPQVKPTQALSTVHVLAASKARAKACVHDACHVQCCNDHLPQQSHVDHSFSGAGSSQRWVRSSRCAV